jgi:hypothetical protein
VRLGIGKAGRYDFGEFSVPGAAKPLGFSQHVPKKHETSMMACHAWIGLFKVSRVSTVRSPGAQ